MMKQRSSKALMAFIIPFLLSCSSAQAEVARDPGPRPTGANDQPQPLEGLTSGQTALFNAGMAKFQGREAVKDGLGPTMNLDSCGGCHSQPTAGGTSPAKNPQFIFFNDNLKKTNRLPPFITENGPVREVRFKRNPDGTADGGVHDVFTITGLAGADGCILKQPNFSPRRNIIFRIPTPTFGAGLIEQIPDQSIIDNQTAQISRRYGVRGKLNIVNAGHTIAVRENRNGNDETTSCQKAPTPNDTTNPDASGLDVLSDIEKFAAFMRFLAPRVPSTDEPGGASSIDNGKQRFHQVGCTACHTPTLRTGHSTVAALDNKDVNLYSDLAIHDMGAGLADGISQGQAKEREFRSAPLWGLGQRLFFLHDGRAKDLVQAIREHRSPGSEANGVVRQFFRLRSKDQQDLLNFLRSL